MGTYLNPGNGGFARILNSSYVDKTGLIRQINRVIGTTKNLICISRPRRFGKSFAAQMLCAYYDKSCNSGELFSRFEIAKAPDYEEHRNKYHVIGLDITSFISEAKNEGISLQEIPRRISDSVQREVLELYPDLRRKSTLTETLSELVRKTETKIVFVIDEWDSMIREAAHDETAQMRYLNLLRGLFKNGNFTPNVVAAAYMTGILPIKKDGSQSAISDFQEYSMLYPGPFAEYVGFTEEEVRRLCGEHHISFENMRRWYDGYTVGLVSSVYNPFSVMSAVESRRFRSYWKKTTAAETLLTYIDMDQDGLQEDIARLIAGESIEVDTDSFRNDLETFTCRDDVLTLLIHLGYLSYEEIADSVDDEDAGVLTGLARIPNEEVRTEFEKILRKAKHRKLAELVQKSDQLLQDTIAGNEAAVAGAVEEIHATEYAPAFYNNEQSLRYLIKMAYISCVDQYAKLEELPSGHGIADIVFLPKKRSVLPAMVVELKWDRSADGAVQQIRERKYPKALEQYGSEILLVGISYDPATKQHSCKIEKYYPQ